MALWYGSYQTFLRQLLGPQCRETDAYGKSFSKGLDEIFRDAIPIGYLLLGHSDQYRWDWNWLQPEDYDERVNGAHPKTPSSVDSDPNLPFVKSPALLLESCITGELHDDSVTCHEAKYEQLLDLESGQAIVGPTPSNYAKT